MEEVLELKFNQHVKLKMLLLSTGEWALAFVRCHNSVRWIRFSILRYYLGRIRAKATISGVTALTEQGETSLGSRLCD